MRERVVTAHIHDNHGEKDETFCRSTARSNGMRRYERSRSCRSRCLLYLKLKTQGAAGPTLEQIRAACDKVEEKFDSLGTGATPALTSGNRARSDSKTTDEPMTQEAQASNFGDHN